jgi:hypothetical protein
MVGISSNGGAGVAYQIVEYVQGAGNIRETKVFTDWPTNAASKVPSEISYSQTSEHAYQWGFDISDDSHKMVWTKLELNQQERKQELQWILDGLIGMRNLDLDGIRGQNGLPSYPAREPVDIVADFLGKVREHFIEGFVRKFSRALFSEMVIDLVVTEPAVV